MIKFDFRNDKFFESFGIKEICIIDACTLDGSCTGLKTCINCNHAKPKAKIYPSFTGEIILDIISIMNKYSLVVKINVEGRERIMQSVIDDSLLILNALNSTDKAKYIKDIKAIFVDDGIQYGEE